LRGGCSGQPAILKNRVNRGSQLAELCANVRAFIKAPTLRDYERLALGLFRHQFEFNHPYRAFCIARRRTPETIDSEREIPAIPAAAFKELDLTVLAPEERSNVFHSSGTTNLRRSRHFHSAETLRLYEESLLAWFKPYVLPDRERVNFLMLSPRLSEAPHSSLVHMFETVSGRFQIDEPAFGATIDSEGGWKLDMEKITQAGHRIAASAVPVVICGTAFSFVHLCDWLQTNAAKLKFPRSSRVFETGGYKGRSRIVSKPELHEMIQHFLGVPASHIIAEYGMSELSSQAYDRTAGRLGAGIFQFPPWARARIISPETGEMVQEGELGLVRVSDLANVGSVMTIQTEDLAIRRGDGFELIGRASRAEARGCSLMEVRA
jgi:hypothetical protein